MTTQDARPIKIEVKNLTKRFGDRLVLDDMNFTIRKGEFLSLINICYAVSVAGLCFRPVEAFVAEVCDDVVQTAREISEFLAHARTMEDK